MLLQLTELSAPGTAAEAVVHRKVSDLNIQEARDLMELGCAHPVGAAFVFLHLLEGQVEARGEAPWLRPSSLRRSLMRPPT